MSTVTVTEIDPPTITVTDDPIEIVEVATPGPQGPQGDAGPDPWAEPIQDLAFNVPGDLTINYALGKYVKLLLNASISTLYVSNWPAAGYPARLTLDITNGAAHTISSFNGVKWAGGVAPTITFNGNDMLVLTTVTGGTRVHGHVVGQNYPA